MIKSFDFFFDFISPYSYLAHKQIRNIELQYKIEINYMPILLSGLLNLAYFYPIVYDAFFRESEVKREEQRGDAPWTMTAPLVFTALIVLVLGVAPDFGFHFYSLAWMAAEQVVSSGVPVSP